MEGTGDKSKEDCKQGDNPNPRISNFDLTRKDSNKSEGARRGQFNFLRPPSFLSIKDSIRRHGNDEDTTPDNNKNPNNSEYEPDLEGSFQSLQGESACFEMSHVMVESSTDPDAEDTGRCIECVKAIPVFSTAEIEKGDHITFPGAIYDHHAIVVDKLSDKSVEVIEATNTFSGVVVSLSLFLGQKAKLSSSRKTFDFTKQKICVIFYRKRKFSKLETVERAKGFLKSGNITENTTADYNYHLFENNCEHFATYCVTGERFSVQVKKIRLISKLFISSGFIGISDEKKRNEKEFENNILCEECFTMNQKLLDVPIRQILNVQDISKGDIIRYSYWNLWHEAVVLEISEEMPSCVKCFIAHYAFCGPFSHRTIIKELVSITFDGAYSKLEYEPPAFHVYDPDTVVRRAESRLNEQMFVFFSNDSSHFARWCKLKLQGS